MPILATVLCLAIPVPPCPAQAGELAAERLEALEARLDELALEHEIPGLSAAVVHRRKVVWSQGYGYADLEAGTFAEPTTRYRIASVSKPFAAVLVMQEVEEGRLSLDAPMRDFRVHAWFGPDPSRYREQPVLVRHVLSHTSEGVPGDAYSYNGNAFVDLTWVLEDVTRTAYPRLLQERIFDPLGMKDSFPGHARPGGKELVELARPYGWDGTSHVLAKHSLIDPDPDLDVSGFDPVHELPEDGATARAELLGEGFVHLNGVSTASGIVTTVLDLAKFDVALDEDRLISAESKAALFAPTISNGGATLPYGLGWFTEEIDGRRVVWHYGWYPPTVSALYVKVPDRELTFLLLANNDRLSAGVAWTQRGVRASPFARAFLEGCVAAE